MDTRFVIKGDLCYSERPSALRTLAGGYVVCENGLCAGVFTALPERYANLPLHDYSGALVLPGLCDLHLHAPQYPFRATGMDLELLEWLDTYTFPEESKYAGLDYAEQAYSLFVQDMLRGPNTRACVFATVHAPATLLLMDKLERSGLVSMVGKVNMDRNSSATLQEDGAGASLAATAGWLDEVRNRHYRNTAPILTPRFVPSCSDALMAGLGELQRTHGLPVQSHLSENPSEVAWVRRLCPTAAGYADAYDRFGLFGGAAPTVMAHCVWVREDEMALMAQRGVFAAHCPQSNLNLSSGIAPVRKFLRHGIPTGLGSDVAGGCQTSILRAMADAVQCSKAYWRLADQNDAPLTLAEVFYMGTLGGGAFFGKAGSFLPGYELDAVVINDSAIPSLCPMDLPRRLERAVYLADDRHIAAKYVRGTQLFTARS